MSEIKALDKLRELVADINAKEIVDHMQLYPSAVFDCMWLDSWHSEFNRLVESLEAEIAANYLELPVDADGVPIHVGDICEMSEVQFKVRALNIDGYCWWAVDGTGEFYIAELCRNVKPRTVDDVMSEYAELSASQDVKKYHEVSDELREIQREQFRDEPEREFFKDFNGYEFYIELPYDEICIGTKNAWVKRHSYSYMYKKPDGGSVYSCSSLCGYSRDWAIGCINDEIARIKSELQMRGDAE